MDQFNKYEALVVTFGEALAQYVSEAKKEQISKKDDPFLDGYILGFHRVVTLLQQQAEILDVPLSEISMDKFNDKDF